MRSRNGQVARNNITMLRRNIANCGDWEFPNVAERYGRDQSPLFARNSRTTSAASRFWLEMYFTRTTSMPPGVGSCHFFHPRMCRSIYCPGTHAWIKPL